MAAPPDLPAIEARLLAFRSAGQLGQAQAWIRALAQQHPELQGLARQWLWTHHPMWWSTPTGRRCRLRRRGPQDLAFVRHAWADERFVASFNPIAAALPADDAALERILAREHSAVLSRVPSLHWTIEALTGEPFGMLSLTDISLAHRRAEVLIGVLSPPYRGAATEATLLAIDFAFGPMKLAKLIGLVPAGNAASLAASEHIGFCREGLLRQHIIDPRSRQPIDLVHMALLADDEAARSKQQRVRRRLLPQHAPVAAPAGRAA